MWLYSYGAVVLYILMKLQLFIFLCIISVFISALYSYGVSFFIYIFMDHLCIYILMEQHCVIFLWSTLYLCSLRASVCLYSDGESVFRIFMRYPCAYILMEHQYVYILM